MRILLVDDDQEFCNSLSIILEHEMFAVDIACNFSEGYEKALVEDYDLMILDWMLPDGTGHDLCQKIRFEKVTTPILMLTAKSMSEDIVEALDAGADDYLAKPFDIKILMARIRALLRRKEALKPEVIEINGLRIDLPHRSVTKENCEITLSPKEFGLLEYLLQHHDRIINRDELLSHIWDENADPLSNIIDVHIRYLRKKIGQNLIKTYRGKGYQIVYDI